MEDKLKVWLARDESGYAFIHREKPHKSTDKGLLGEWLSLGALTFDKEFPSVKWEDDEPTEAYITLAEPQEQPKQEQPTPKQEIDWEQRRYEIAKEMLPIIYWHGMEAQKHGQSVKRKDTAYYAVIFADMLIEELMKGE